MSKVISFSFAAALAAGSVFGQANMIAKWDPAMAESKAVVDTNGVKWIDGRYLPIEGRWELGDTEHYYSRLPDTLTTNVNAGVRNMRKHTSGMLFRFHTDSNFIIIRHKPMNGWHAMPHMTEVGTSGWDVYRFATDEKKWYQFGEPSGRWWFLASNHGSREVPGREGWKEKRVNLPSGDNDIIINLPLYNGVGGFELGIVNGATVSALGPRRSGIDRPVVVYGTSITHGGCCTRPGLGFVNIVGRELDVPVHGLGFSGSGVMEYELSEVIAKIDASCYVLDCLWNMGLTEKQRHGRAVETNYEPFIRNLRRLRPGVPIVMCEQSDVFFRPGVNCNRFRGKNDFIRELYEKLVDEGWDDLYYLPADNMFVPDAEGTVDGCHFNDLGMRSMADALEGILRKALDL